MFCWILALFCKDAISALQRISEDLNTEFWRPLIRKLYRENREEIGEEEGVAEEAPSELVETLDVMGDGASFANSVRNVLTKADVYSKLSKKVAGQLCGVVQGNNELCKSCGITLLNMHVFSAPLARLRMRLLHEDTTNESLEMLAEQIVWYENNAVYLLGDEKRIKPAIAQRMTHLNSYYRQLLNLARSHQSPAVHATP